VLGDIRMAKLFSLFVCCFLTTTVQAGILGPVNYNECITDAMKGVKSDLAAQKIDEACQQRFLDGQKHSRQRRELIPQETALVTGSGGAVSHNANYFVGSIYNGNQQGTIKAVTIYLIPKVPAESFQDIVKEMSAVEEERLRRPRETRSVRLSFDDIERKKKEMEGRLRYYHLDIEIPSLSTRSFSVQILPSDAVEQGYEWGIVSAEVE